MGETVGGAVILLLIIVASKLIISSVVITLVLLYLFGRNRLRRYWSALTLGVVVGCAVSFIAGAVDGVEFRSPILNLIFTVPPALVTSTLWWFARLEADGYRSNRALFAHVGLWVFLGMCVILVPFSLVGLFS